MLFISLLVASLSFTFSDGSYAQNRYADSLKNELNKSNLPDSVRLRILLELGNHLYLSDKTKASKYFWNVYRTAQNKKNNYYRGEALSGLGNACYERSDYDSALYYYHWADSLYSTDTSEISRESRASNKASMGNIEVMRNNYETAMHYFMDAIVVMNQSTADNKWKVIGNLYADIANIYNDMGQSGKALDYDLKALRSHKKQPNNLLLTGMLELYVASDYTSLRKMDAARSHLTRAASIAAALGSFSFYYSLYSEWGRFYQKSSRLSEAVDNFQQALHYAKEKGGRFDIMNAYRMLGFAYRDMQDHTKSAAALESALQLARELKNYRLEAELLKNLALVEANRHDDHDATQYYLQYVQLSDSLNESDLQKRVNEIENKYRAKQRQDSILVLQKNNDIQQLALHKRRNLNIALLTVLLLSGLIGALLYRNSRHRHYILKQNELLHTRRISELEKEHQLVAMQSVLKGQEEERGRLAKDLHDGVGGLLSGVKLSLSTMKGNVFLSEESATAVERVLKQLDQSIAELRRVSHNMMPESLIKFGLGETIESYCAQINQNSALRVRFQSYGLEQRLDESSEIIIYRILQELLSNILKHADARQVLVQLIREAKRFDLTVEDDGKGFITDAVTAGNGAGLSNIRSRVAYLGGKLDIHSVPGQGTSVHIEIPLT
ncbi:MAG TPA: sensor histidine kinase [Edaphocola sp.]|nr:sensor histidine kinase [Edaphocola sp.]